MESIVGFACPQGLVLELAKQVASKQYLAFYEKWKEADEDRLTDRQLSQIEEESPLGECPAVLLTCNGRNCKATEPWGWAGIRQTFWKSWNGNRIRRQKPAGSIMV